MDPEVDQTVRHEPPIQPPIQYQIPQPPSPSFFTPKVFVLGVIVCIFLLLLGSILLRGNTSSSKKPIAPTPAVYSAPSLTPTPIIYPTSYPDSTEVPTPIATGTILPPAMRRK
jgi:hypothetical protein